MVLARSIIFISFPIREELSELLKLPVSIQNDANCAALAEVWQGNAQNVNNSACLIIGSGIGGAVVVDKKLISGSHLFGGEFGFMIIDYKKNITLSGAGSPVTMGRNFSNDRTDGKYYSGADVFALAESQKAKDYVDDLLQAIAVGAYNLAVTFDPEIILVGGAISQNQKVILEINERLDWFLLSNPVSF
ncbi:ROK family protein [Enterococcus sp. AZ196]|uniref:ROK family protein n=1 Tax=Enterococcus sp. AZ196 TaxID=2774659 RepID=UPI003D2D3E57